MQNDRKYGTRIVLIFGLLGIFAPLSPAAIIDDFSTPQGPLTAGGSGAVSGPDIIGGVRQAGGGSFFEVSGGIATFSFSLQNGGANVMNITYDGTTALDDISTFPAVDLTDGGIASHFLLGISSIEGALSIAMGAIDVDGQTASAVFSGMTAPGVYAVPLVANFADLTRISFISATLFLSPVASSTASVGIDFLCTGNLEAGCTTTTPTTAVPEPGEGVVLALFAASLPLLRRRSKYCLMP